MNKWQTLPKSYRIKCFHYLKAVSLQDQGREQNVVSLDLKKKDLATDAVIHLLLQSKTQL